MLSLSMAGCRAAEPPAILAESWQAYKQHFIQADGRVIDQKTGGISTSEGQAYAMLRAVWMADRSCFDKTFDWARNNLNSGVRRDHLWAWKWGKAADGRWKTLDPAFASDAEEDAVVALILAFQVWKDEKYLRHARARLDDLWTLGTIQSGGQRFLLAGDTSCRANTC